GWPPSSTSSTSGSAAGSTRASWPSSRRSPTSTRSTSGSPASCSSRCTAAAGRPRRCGATRRSGCGWPTSSAPTPARRCRSCTARCSPARRRSTTSSPRERPRGRCRASCPPRRRCSPAGRASSPRSTRRSTTGGRSRSARSAAPAGSARRRSPCTGRTATSTGSRTASCVNLRGFDGGFSRAAEPLAPDVAIRTFLDGLGVEVGAIAPGLDGQAALSRSLVAGRRMLVLLDNARDTEQVAPLLPGSPGCAVLVTSRRQLGGLVAVHGARSLPLDVLPDAEARALLAGHLGRERLDAEPDAVDAVLRACAGLPLALAIVAARASTRPHLPLAAVAEELQNGPGRLDALDAGDARADLRSVFSWSYRALRPEAARLFRRLGLHPGPDVGLPAAAGLAGVDVHEVRPLLAELTGASLLTEHRPGRFVLHDLLRAYAAERGEAEDTEA